MNAPTPSYMRAMAERKDTPRVHRVHLLADARPMSVSQDALDEMAENQYFGKGYRKIAVCKCGLRHNGDCY